MQPNKLHYLESWTEELLSCANRVRDLIGDKHWLSDGHHKEYLIRTFLRKHLPAHLLISRGFVSPATNSGPASREIDVLISDPAAAAPWLNESDLTIVPPDSVIAHIHSKTTFSQSELKDALHSVDDAQIICEESESFDRIWTAVFFFSKGFFDDIDEFADVIATSISAGRKGAHLPDYITVFDGPLIIVGQSNETAEGSTSLRCFASFPNSFALALANLFDHLATERTQRASDWNAALGMFNLPPPISRVVKT